MTPTASCSVPIPAGPRRRSRTFTLLLASAVMVLAGCGGDSDSLVNRESVETTMSDVIRANVVKQGGTMDQLECVEDGDNLHWHCITTARLDGQAYTLTVRITCDGETGRCISEPASFAPVP